MRVNIIRGASLLLVSLFIVCCITVAGNAASFQIFKPDVNVGLEKKEKWHAVTFSDNGKELKNESVRLELVVPDEVRKEWKGVSISVKDKKTGVKKKYQIGIGENMKIPDSELDIKAVAILPDFQIKHQIGIITSTSNKPNNPAAKIVIQERGKELFRSWIYQKLPTVNAFNHEKFEVLLIEAIK